VDAERQVHLNLSFLPSLSLSLLVAMLFSWSCACILAALWLQIPRLAEGAEYNLLRDYSGPTFFDGWEFYDASKSNPLAPTSF
jgi:hypothetical protein